MIVGQGCDYSIYGRPLTRHDLDAILPDRPIILVAADHHTGWANTLALTEAGILQGATVGPGNEVVMGADGLATGELREFEAMAPVLRVAGEHRIMAGIATGFDPLPAPTQEEVKADLPAMAAGLAHCARHGFTSLVNMDGNRYTLDVLDTLRRDGRLTARVRVPFHYRNTRSPADLAGIRPGDRIVDSGRVALFDGAQRLLGGRVDQLGGRHGFTLPVACSRAASTSPANTRKSSRVSSGCHCTARTNSSPGRSTASPSTPAVCSPGRSQVPGSSPRG